MTRSGERQDSGIATALPPYNSSPEVSLKRRLSSQHQHEDAGTVEEVDSASNATSAESLSSISSSTQQSALTSSSNNDAPLNFTTNPGRVDIGAKDYRHPLYLAGWSGGVRGGRGGGSMAVDDMDEPHIKRKLEILSRYPQVKELYGYEPWSKWITLVAVSAQMGLSYLFGRVLTDWPWTMLITSYVVGGSITALYGSLIHEITHDLTASTTFRNRMVGFLLNVPIPFPIAMSFRRYHLEHHTFQGVEGKDPDLPLPLEMAIVRSGGAIIKFCWLFFYPAMYVIRGAAQQKPLTTWEIINIAWTVACVSFIFWFNGPIGFAYLFASLWLGYGIHPAAAHFIQEHYTFEEGQETFSYYGSGNWFFLNLGYHNEHHDFSRIPWSRLSDLHNLAPEYYKTLAYHTSWWKVMYDFLFSSGIGPQSRVVRDMSSHRKGRAMLKRK